MQEYELDNILMAQKNELLEKLNEAFHTPDMREEFGYFDFANRLVKQVLDRLAFVLPLWNEARYGYKAQEIIRRIEAATKETKDNLHHSASLKRSECVKILETCSTLYSMCKTIHDLPVEQPKDTVPCWHCGNPMPKGKPLFEDTRPTVAEQVCGLSSGIDNGPISHEE